MVSENIFDILKRNNLDCSSVNYNLHKDFSKTIADEKEIVQKIIDYNDYIESNNNKYSEEVMQYLRQRRRLDKYDFSKDEELCKMTPNKVFDEVVKWNGLLGGYADTIKEWVKNIYGIDLDSI